MAFFAPLAEGLGEAAVGTGEGAAGAAGGAEGGGGGMLSKLFGGMQFGGGKHASGGNGGQNDSPDALTEPEGWEHS